MAGTRKVHIYFEGDPSQQVKAIDPEELHTKRGRKVAGTHTLKKAFTRFLRKAVGSGVELNLLVDPHGDIRTTVKDFNDAVATPSDDVTYLLLVDSDGGVATGVKQHLQDRLKRSYGTSIRLARAVKEEQVHLTVQCMEAWLIADVDTFVNFFSNKPGFRSEQLPKRPPEEVPCIRGKLHGLDEALAQTEDRGYEKLRHGIPLLFRVDPQIVYDKCPHFKRLLDKLRSI